MDDEEMMRLINKKMFEHYGCTVTLATNGEEAIDLYRKKSANGRRFDLVLLDLRVRWGHGRAGGGGQNRGPGPGGGHGRYQRR